MSGFNGTPPQGFRATSVIDAGTAVGGGTANGVLYVNSSGNLDSGSVLAFNGTNLSMASGQFLAPDGTQSLPGYGFSSSGNEDMGFYLVNATTLGMTIAGGNRFLLSTSGSGSLRIPVGFAYEWSSTSSGTGTADLFLTREAAATLQMGVDVNAAAVAQTFKAHDGITGTDIAGASMTIASGRGTGAGASGSVIFSTSTTLGTGTTAQTLVTRLTLSAGAVTTDNATLTFADKLDIVLNATTGTKIGTATTQKLSFYNSTPVIQQVSAADLTNNVTAGGTDNTVDNVVAADVDATAARLVETRNAIYQLARKLKQVNDALRVYGLLS